MPGKASLVFIMKQCICLLSLPFHSCFVFLLFFLWCFFQLGMNLSPNSLPMSLSSIFSPSPQSTPKVGMGPRDFACNFFLSSTLLSYRCGGLSKGISCVLPPSQVCFPFPSISSVLSLRCMVCQKQRTSGAMGRRFTFALSCQLPTLSTFLCTMPEVLTSSAMKS